MLQIDGMSQNNKIDEGKLNIDLLFGNLGICDDEDDDEEDEDDEKENKNENNNNSNNNNNNNNENNNDIHKYFNVNNQNGGGHNNTEHLNVPINDAFSTWFNIWAVIVMVVI